MEEKITQSDIESSNKRDAAWPRRTTRNTK